MRHRLLVAIALSVVAACADDSAPSSPRADVAQDVSSPPDAAPDASDSGPPPDGGDVPPPDSVEDAWPDTADPGPSPDVLAEDAPSPLPDADLVDVPDADSGPLDAGPLDAGPLDAGPLDAGPLDAGPLDAEGDADVQQALLTHPLTDGAQLRRIFDLHTLAASGTLNVAKRLFDAGTSECPGALTVTAKSQAGAFGFGCTLSAEPGEVQIDGRMNFEIPNTCSGSSSTLNLVETSSYAVHGAWDDAPVDLYFDLDYRRESPPSGLEWEWSGTARWGSFPHSWFPNTWEILEGTTVRGVGLKRTGDSSDGVTWSGTMFIQGVGGVRITTLKPVATKEPDCFVPSQGVVRLEGAATATIVFDGKGECAPPTWTRDGVPMGEVEIKGWGFLTICFSPV